MKCIYIHTQILSYHHDFKEPGVAGLCEVGYNGRPVSLYTPYINYNFLYTDCEGIVPRL